MSDRIFGHIPGTKPGDTFVDRRSLSAAGVHRPVQAGISGSQYSGADSIVLSGGYEDDQDHGNTIIYTGHGGRDPTTGQQVAHQSQTRGNKALALNVLTGNPVRVVRGARHTSPYSPPSGYRYDGLYRVVSSWQDRGNAGFFVQRFQLESIPDQCIDMQPLPGMHPHPPARRAETIVQRIVRDTSVAQSVKVIHRHRCQVCDTRLEAPAGPYAEAAHIRPLGTPHDGPDVTENILCLCPNHHVLFDRGAFSIRNDLSFIGFAGELRTMGRHRVGVPFLHYHREHFFDPNRSTLHEYAQE